VVASAISPILFCQSPTEVEKLLLTPSNRQIVDVPHARHYAEPALPFRIEQVFPPFRYIVGVHVLRIIRRQNDLIGERHRSVVVMNCVGIDAQRSVVEGYMKFTFPQRSVKSIDENHDIPLRRRTRGGFADILADIRRHAAGRRIMDSYVGTEPVLRSNR
jgi:hypothetical protein